MPPFWSQHDQLTPPSPQHCPSTTRATVKCRVSKHRYSLENHSCSVAVDHLFDTIRTRKTLVITLTSFCKALWTHAITTWYCACIFPSTSLVLVFCEAWRFALLRNKKRSVWKCSRLPVHCVWCVTLSFISCASGWRNWRVLQQRSHTGVIVHKVDGLHHKLYPSRYMCELHIKSQRPDRIVVHINLTAVLYLVRLFSETYIANHERKSASLTNALCDFAVRLLQQHLEVELFTHVLWI